MLNAHECSAKGMKLAQKFASYWAATLVVRIAILLFLSSVFLCGTQVGATPIEMVCENPHREYILNYDPEFGTVYANETAYHILAVENTAERLVVAGVTVADGPTFRLHIRPYKKLEFFSGNQLTQTDGCK